VLWEQPEVDGVEPELIGWGELTVDLAGVADLDEAIEWAERKLASSEGPYSRSGTPVRDREIVIYARVPGNDHFLQVVGWDPSRKPASDNLRRYIRGHR
jgi:hypothetical protein